MLRAFHERKTWAVALISLLSGPTIGMLYINRGLMGFIYFLLTLALVALPFALGHYDGVNPFPLLNDAMWAITAVGVVHCCFITRRTAFPGPLWYARWQSLVFLFTLLPLAVTLGFRTFFYAPYHVPSRSMVPALLQDDYFFADKQFSPGELKRGDVIVFHSPKHPAITYVKRIMGLPGEHIQFKQGILYINDAPLARRPVEEYRESKNNKPVQQFIETTPEGRQIRIIQSNPESPMNNTPVYDIPAGNYFVLGDNRDNSRDSRFLEDMGTIPGQDIIGKASAVWWNKATYKFSHKPIE